MALLLLGIGFDHLPLAAREACRLGPEQAGACLGSLWLLSDGAHADAALAGVAEAVVLATCHRLEFYVVAEAAAGRRLLQGWLAQVQDSVRRRVQDQAQADLTPHVRQAHGPAVVEHLLRVACGLASPPGGEGALEAHLAAALALAAGCGTAGPVLARLFRQAIQTGACVRSAPGPDANAGGYGQAALGYLARQPGERAQGRVLVAGAGRLARAVAEAVQARPGVCAAFINRTAARAEALAHQTGGQFFPWHQMQAALAWADGVIAATAACRPILDAADVLAVLPARRGRPLLLVDLGLPRNIDPAVAALRGVGYCDLVALQAALAEPETVCPACAAARAARACWVQAESAALWAELGA